MARLGKIKGFTLIELIFVIVIGGIIAYFTLGKTDPDPLRLAATQMVRHINYTRHLAMVDEKFEGNDSTYTNEFSTGTKQGLFARSRWAFRLEDVGDNNGWFYTVYSDRDRKSNVDWSTHQEAAKDPGTKKFIGYKYGWDNNTTQTLLNKWGITPTFSSSCNASASKGILYFDNIGRVYAKNYGATPAATEIQEQYKNILTTDCNITLSRLGEGGQTRTAVITITPETGFTSISHFDPE